MDSSIAAKLRSLQDLVSVWNDAFGHQLSCETNIENPGHWIFVHSMLWGEHASVELQAEQTEEELRALRRRGEGGRYPDGCNRYRILGV